jgi:hypothetical protein
MIARRQTFAGMGGKFLLRQAKQTASRGRSRRACGMSAPIRVAPSVAPLASGAIVPPSAVRSGTKMLSGRPANPNESSVPCQERLKMNAIVCGCPEMLVSAGSEEKRIERKYRVTEHELVFVCSDIEGL